MVFGDTISLSYNGFGDTISLSYNECLQLAFNFINNGLHDDESCHYLLLMRVAIICECFAAIANILHVGGDRPHV